MSIYLDHAATTPLLPEVAEAIARAQADAFANPSSQHAAGRRAKRLLEESRERILAALGAQASGPGRDGLIFTSGASEANRLGIVGFSPVTPGIAATSARDHSSLRLAVTDLERRGWRSTDLRLSAAGRLDPTDVAAWAEGGAAPRILATTLVCGQTGVVEDLATLATASARQCVVHADATQAVVTESLSFQDIPVATMTCAPHKFGGPRGIGGLVVRHGHPLQPLLPGTQETGLRGGTEPVALAAGFATAIECAVSTRIATRKRLDDLQHRLEAGIQSAAVAIGIPVHVIAAEAGRSPHISTISFPGRDRQAIVMAADLAGLCCATGSACASGSSEPAPALISMGIPPNIVQAAVRFSLGRDTTPTDIDEALKILTAVLRQGIPS